MSPQESSKLVATLKFSRTIRNSLKNSSSSLAGTALTVALQTWCSLSSSRCFEFRRVSILSWPRRIIPMGVKAAAALAKVIMITSWLQAWPMQSARCLQRPTLHRPNKIITPPRTGQTASKSPPSQKSSPIASKWLLAKSQVMGWKIRKIFKKVRLRMRIRALCTIHRWRNRISCTMLPTITILISLHPRSPADALKSNRARTLPSYASTYPWATAKNAQSDHPVPPTPSAITTRSSIIPD